MKASSLAFCFLSISAILLTMPAASADDQLVGLEIVTPGLKLEKFASDLRSRFEGTWEETIQELSTFPTKQEQEALAVESKSFTPLPISERPVVIKLCLRKGEDPGRPPNALWTMQGQPGVWSFVSGSGDERIDHAVIRLMAMGYWLEEEQAQLFNLGKDCGPHYPAPLIAPDDVDILLKFENLPRVKLQSKDSSGRGTLIVQKTSKLSARVSYQAGEATGAVIPNQRNKDREWFLRVAFWAQETGRVTKNLQL